MNNTINANWLIENIDNKNIVIIDCRFNLMDKEYGKTAYKNGHIKGAKRVDIERELSGLTKIHGGRHPIPNINKLINTFENLGISNDSTVICYDDGNLAGASRLWWLLKYLGHNKSYVLNGGFKSFKKAGGEISTENEINVKGKLYVNIQEYMNIDMGYIKDKTNNKNALIIDSREHRRYTGEHEPVDIKAGHIPGAVNYFWMDVLEKTDYGFHLKSKDKLKEHFNELNKFDEIILYCGSGITACVNSLALSELGIKHRLYSGSFSDWISYSENTIETK